MDLVEEEHVTGFELGQQPGESAQIGEQAAQRRYELTAATAGNAARQHRLARARGPHQQGVGEGLPLDLGPHGVRLELLANPGEPMQPGERPLPAACRRGQLVATCRRRLLQRRCQRRYVAAKHPLPAALHAERRRMTSPPATVYPGRDRRHAASCPWRHAATVGCWRRQQVNDTRHVGARRHLAFGPRRAERDRWPVRADRLQQLGVHESVTAQAEGHEVGRHGGPAVFAEHDVMRVEVGPRTAVPAAVPVTGQNLPPHPRRRGAIWKGASPRGASSDTNWPSHRSAATSPTSSPRGTRPSGVSTDSPPPASVCT